MIFILAPTVYYVVSFTQKNERTDYPGKKLGKQIEDSNLTEMDELWNKAKKMDC